MQELTREDAIASVWGGLVLGAGGGGLEAGLAAVDAVFQLGVPRLATLDEFPDDALAAVTTGVGAPGGKKVKVVFPSDTLLTMQMLRERLRRDGRGDIVGAIIGHPGAGMARSWMLSALDKSQVVLDCATNGRGHPSVRMGSMGITDDLTHRIILTASGGLDDVDGRMTIEIESPLGLGSDVLRKAAAALGGSIAAARGPFTIGFLKQHGAVGAISTSIRLGHAMLDAEGKSAAEKAEVIAKTLGGEVRLTGKITENSIKLDGAYDVGHIKLDTTEGPASIGVVNEYMSLDLNGDRLATFPDYIGLFSAKDGSAVGATPAAVGDEVHVVTVPRKNIPIGAGATDPASFPNTEALLGLEFVKYL